MYYFGTPGLVYIVHILNSKDLVIKNYRKEKEEERALPPKDFWYLKPGLHISRKNHKHMFVNTFLSFPGMPFS